MSEGGLDTQAAQRLGELVQADGRWEWLDTGENEFGNYCIEVQGERFIWELWSWSDWDALQEGQLRPDHDFYE